MSFKLTSPFKKHATPIVNVPMEQNVMGRADKRGNILINKDLKKYSLETINDFYEDAKATKYKIWWLIN